MNDRHVYRDYARGLTAPGEPQRIGTPRPGFGTVYVHLTNIGEREPHVVWAADWVDDFGEFNHDSEVAGVETIEGGRDEVLAWVRSQPAAEFLMPGGDGWVPLPTDDDAVALNVPDFPSRRRR